MKVSAEGFSAPVYIGVIARDVRACRAMSFESVDDELLELLTCHRSVPGLSKFKSEAAVVYMLVCCMCLFFPCRSMVKQHVCS